MIKKFNAKIIFTLSLSFGVIYFLVIPGKIFAFTLPDVPVIPHPSCQNLESCETSLKINNQNFGYNVEIIPQIIPQPDNSRLYILPTSWTHFCRSAGNILNSSTQNPLNLNSNQCHLSFKPEYVQNINSQGSIVHNPPPADINNVWLQDWRRGYNGAFGTHIINTNSGNRIVTVRHGEHANIFSGGYRYQGAVKPQVNVNSCSSGYKDANGGTCDSGEVCTFQTCWESFASFVSISWAPYNTQSGWQSNTQWTDEGPVIWPPIEYVHPDGTTQWTGGVYHPTMFAGDDGYLYIYTINTLPKRPGAQCIISARSPIGSGGMAGTWKNYFNGAFANDSLPAGFSKNNIRNFYRTAGNDYTCIFEDEKPDNSINAAVWFNVAKIAGTPFYIGAEEISPGYNTWAMGIRLSYDLVNWTPLQTLMTSNKPWGQGQSMNYPTFLNKAGNNSSAIEPDEFYILGNTAMGSYDISALKLSLQCPAMNVTTNFNYNRVGQTFNLTWDKNPRAAWYSVRIDDITGGIGFNTNCKTPNPGDICIDEVMENKYSFQAQPNHKYNVWVEGRNMCGSFSPAAYLYNLEASSNHNIPDLISQFQNNSCDNPFDLNNDCQVNIFDYSILVKQY